MPKLRLSLPQRFTTAARALVEGTVSVTVPSSDRIDPDDDLFRRITGSRRDLNPITQAKAQAVCLHLWRQNPMAHRLIEMMVDFVVGSDGITITANDDRAQDVVDEFWTDPVMRLDLRHRDLVRDLSLYGELASLAPVNETSGRMRLGVLDVARIHDVLFDPDNVLVDRTLLVKPTDGTMTTTAVPLMNYDDVTEPGSPKWVGQAFYFAVNRAIGQHRGTPDFLAIADWIDGYDQLLFNALERSGLINAFVWDVTLKGVDDAAVDKWVSKHREPPPPGSVNVHTEQEVWQAVSPGLNSADTTTIGRAIKNMALGGAGVPEAWFAEGDSANRATLSAQGDPTYRMLQSRQRYVRAMFEQIVSVAIERGVEAGRLPSSIEDRGVSIVLPELANKDTTAISAALPQVANALTAAISEELISKQSARAIFVTIAGQLGVDLDPATEEELIEEEAAEKEPEPAVPAMLDDMLGQDPEAGVPNPSSPHQNAAMPVLAGQGTSDTPDPK